MHQVRQAAGYWAGPNLFPLHVEADEATALTKSPCNKLSYELRHRETGDSQLATRSGGLSTENWTSRANEMLLIASLPVPHLECLFAVYLPYLQSAQSTES